MIKVPNMDAVKNYISTTLINELTNELMIANPLLDSDTALSMATQQVNNRYIINTTSSSTQILVKKFMCTADIVPTLFDLCVINMYGNLYFRSYQDYGY